jgi:hypothetical protein
LLSAVPPEVPPRGSVEAPLSHLLFWRPEILSAQGVSTMARFERAKDALETANAAAKAADAAVEAAEAALKAAEVSEKIAAQRFITSDERFRTAWRNYHFLVSRMLSFVRFSPDSVPCPIVARRYCGG